MKRSLPPVLACCLLLILNGCVYLGDRPSLTRTIYLSFPASSGQTNLNLSVGNTNLQSALEIIDMVLSANGFVRETNADEAKVPGYVASYVKYITPELREGILPYVYLKQGQLAVEISELGNRSTHPSPLTKKMSKSLSVELASRFGRRNVKIRDWP